MINIPDHFLYIYCIRIIDLYKRCIIDCAVSFSFRAIFQISINFSIAKFKPLILIPDSFPTSPSPKSILWKVFG